MGDFRINVTTFSARLCALCANANGFFGLSELIPGVLWQGPFFNMCGRPVTARWLLEHNSPPDRYDLILREGIFPFPAETNRALFSCPASSFNLGGTSTLIGGPGDLSCFCSSAYLDVTATGDILATFAENGLAVAVMHSCGLGTGHGAGLAHLDGSGVTPGIGTTGGAAAVAAVSRPLATAAATGSAAVSAVGLGPGSAAALGHGSAAAVAVGLGVAAASGVAVVRGGGPGTALAHAAGSATVTGHSEGPRAAYAAGLAQVDGYDPGRRGVHASGLAVALGVGRSTAIARGIAAGAADVLGVRYVVLPVGAALGSGIVYGRPVVLPPPNYCGTLTDAAKLELLRAMRPVYGTWQIILFSANPIPTQQVQIWDCTEASFAGYARKQVLHPQAPILDGLGHAVIVADPVMWVNLGSVAATVTGWGYYVPGSWTPLRSSGRFNTPRVIAPGAALALVPMLDDTSLC